MDTEPESTENNPIKPGHEDLISNGRVSYTLCPRCHHEITSKWQLVICPFCEMLICQTCTD